MFEIYPFPYFLIIKFYAMIISELHNYEYYRSVLKKSNTYKTAEGKLNYLIEFRNNLQLIIKPTIKVKLVSKSELKDALRILNEVNGEISKLQAYLKSKQNILKKLSQEKINLKEVRTKDEYILWKGKVEELNKLFYTLYEKKGIIKIIRSNIVKAIKEHFYITDEVKRLSKAPAKIQWGQTQSLLVYMFEVLYKKGYVDNSYYSLKYIQLSKHFLSKQGKLLTNKYLEKQYSQSITNSYLSKPNNYEWVESLLKEALKINIA